MYMTRRRTDPVRGGEMLSEEFVGGFTIIFAFSAIIGRALYAPITAAIIGVILGVLFGLICHRSAKRKREEVG